MRSSTLNFPRRPVRNLHAAVLLAVCALGLSIDQACWAADGGNRGAARELGYEGIDDYQNGRYEVAADKLDRSYRALPVPSLGLWSARAFEKSGRLVEAAERYLEAVRAPAREGSDIEIQEKARKTAREEHAELLPRIPRLTVALRGVQPRDVEAYVDGSPIASTLLGRAIPVNPGRVSVRVNRGQEVVEKVISLREAEQKQIEVSFEARETPTMTAHPKDGTRPEWPRFVGWGSLAAGGALLGVGVGTGIAALTQYNHLDCDKDGNCVPPTEQDDIQRVNTLRAVSLAGFIGGGVLAATGVSLVLGFRDHKAQKAGISPYLSLTSCGVRGEF